MKIQYLLNSGVLFRTETHQIAIDAIFSDNNLFSSINDKQKKKIKKTIGEFNGETIFIFTHGHADHFDLMNTVKLIQEYERIRKVYIPLDVDISQISDMHIFGRFQRLSDDVHEWCFGDFFITLFPSRHIPLSPTEKEKCCDHYSISITDGTKQCFLTGDSYPQFEGGNILYQKDFDIIFANPFYLGSESQINRLKELKTSCGVYIYHLPEAGHDDYNYYNMAESNRRKYGEGMNHIKMVTKQFYWI